MYESTKWHQVLQKLTIERFSKSLSSSINVRHFPSESPVSLIVSNSLKYRSQLYCNCSQNHVQNITHKILDQTFYLKGSDKQTKTFHGRWQIHVFFSSVLYTGTAAK